MSFIGVRSDEEQLSGRDGRSCGDLFKNCESFHVGHGVYPLAIDFEHMSTSKKAGVLESRIVQVIGAIGSITANRLVIHVSGHNSSGNFLIGGVQYSVESLHTLIVRISSAFRHSRGRMVAPVLVILNICALDVASWDGYVQSCPPAQRYEVLMFRNPVLIGEMPHHVTSLLRVWMNKLLWVDPSFTTAAAVGASMSMVEQNSSLPALLVPGCAPTLRFGALPVVAYRTLSTSASTVSAVPLVDSRPVWPTVTRNRALLAHLRSLLPSTRTSDHYSHVPLTQLVGHLNLLARLYCPVDHCSVPFLAPLSPSDSKWARTHWLIGHTCVWLADTQLSS